MSILYPTYTGLRFDSSDPLSEIDIYLASNASDTSYSTILYLTTWKDRSAVKPVPAHMHVYLQKGLAIAHFNLTTLDFQTAQQDCSRAIRFLKSQSFPDFSVDREQVILWGEGLAGHVALWTGIYRDIRPSEESEPRGVRDVPRFVVIVDLKLWDAHTAELNGEGSAADAQLRRTNTGEQRTVKISGTPLSVNFMTLQMMQMEVVQDRKVVPSFFIASGADCEADVEAEQWMAAFGDESGWSCISCERFHHPSQSVFANIEGQKLMEVKLEEFVRDTSRLSAWLSHPSTVASTETRNYDVC